MADTKRIREWYLGMELPVVKHGPPLGTNNANAAALMPLLDQLATMTDDLVKSDRARWVLAECKNALKPISPVPCEEEVSLRYDNGGYEDDTTIELNRWRWRLAYYFDACNEAVSAGQGADPQAILYTVTSPLFFGWYYPEEWPEDVRSEGLPEVGQAYWDVRRVADLGTPFALAAGLETAVRFEEDLGLGSSLAATAGEYAAEGGRALGQLWDAAAAAIDDATGPLKKAASTLVWVVGGTLVLGVVVYAATR